MAEKKRRSGNRGRKRIEGEARTEQFSVRLSPTVKRLADYVLLESDQSAAELVTSWIREEAKRIALERALAGTTYGSLQELILANWDALSDSRLSERLIPLRDGEPPTDLDIARLALYLGLSEDLVIQLAKKGRRNGAASST